MNNKININNPYKSNNSSWVKLKRNLSKNDIFEPMKKFKTEIKKPELKMRHNLSIKHLLVEQKSFHANRANTYEKLNNIGAAITAYRRASYYQPTDTNILIKIHKLKMKNLINIKS